MQPLSREARARWLATRRREGFKAALNPNSLGVLRGCKLEPLLKDTRRGSGFQFERQGNVCMDNADPVKGRPVFQPDGGAPRHLRKDREDGRIGVAYPRGLRYSVWARNFQVCHQLEHASRTTGN